MVLAAQGTVRIFLFRIFGFAVFCCFRIRMQSSPQMALSLSSSIKWLKMSAIYLWGVLSTNGIKRYTEKSKSGYNLAAKSVNYGHWKV